MALFAVLGYMFGSASALLVLIMVVLGLLLVANAGGRIITLINAIYRFTVAGGFAVMSGGGDLGALRTKMNAVAPLIPSQAAGAVTLLILVVIIVLAILLGRHPRFRRPSSGVGLLVGLASGYLLGAYLLTQVVPSVAAILPLPFGLGGKGGAPAPTGTGINFGAQLLQAIGAANVTGRAFVISIVVAAIIIIALLMSLRSRGGGRGHNGARSRD